MRASRAILAPLAVAFACTVGCGAATPDPLVGTWNLTGVTCNGEARSIQAGFSFKINYGADGRFVVTMSGTNCTSRIVTGRYNRAGLSISETPEFQTCDSGCAFTLPSASISCSGTSVFAPVGTYRINIPVETTMEQFGFSDLTLCNQPANRFMEEVETFTKE